MRAIDFGTSSTAAAQRIDGGLAELVTFRGNYAFPSCVATHEGDLVCGEEAEGILPGDPAAGTRVPKLILAENGTAYLGGRLVPVEEIIAPILREADGGDAASVPGPRILTHPANWEPQSAHCASLLDAARRAGLDDVELISEPEAVAWHLAERLAEGTTFGLFDLGGGTCDIAALERVPDGFELLARPRAETIGGELANSLLTELVLERLDELDEEAADALRAAQRLRDSASASSIDSETLTWLQCLIGVERQIRFAKTRPSPRVRLPLPMRGIIEITQAELSERMRPHLERAAAALGAVLDEAGLDAATTPVMLSGAASVMPDVAQTLQDKCGVTVTPIRPAKGAVALGALAALEAQRTPRTPLRIAPDAPSGAQTRHHARVQENVTQLVRDLEGKDTPASARTWLLDAVLNPPEDEEIAFFATGVGLVLAPPAPSETEVALLVTSARVLWAGETFDGQPVCGQLGLSDASDVVPMSSVELSPCGVRIEAGGQWTGFEVLTGEQDLLGWIAHIGERLGSGAPRDGGVLLAKLRQLEDEPIYVPESLVHAVVTAEAPEEIVWLQKCLDGETFLLTTSERLVWTRGVSSAASQARLVDLDNIQTIRNPEEGLNAFRITVKGETHDFRVGRVHTNVIYINKQRGQVPKTWLTNVAKLYEYPAWADIEAAARNWIENAVVGEDEEVLEFAHCRYRDFGSWGRLDGANTTALLLTTKRVMWARVGSVTGPGFGSAPVEWVTEVEGGNDHLTVTIGSVATGFYTPTPNIFGQAHRAPLAGTKHGFWWEPAAGLVKQLKQLHAESRGR